MSNPFTPNMLALFDGHRNAYGQFKEDGTIREDGKIKGSGITVRNPLAPHLWDDHLAGKKQLGIVPINEDSKTKFGAIDIDDYSVDKEAINIKIVHSKLPVTMFRSKSGGVHLYIFVEDYVPAEIMQNALRQIASFLGHGTAEIFPKQSKIIKERGDIGQWINMPYFDCNKTIRYCIRSEDNRKMSLAQFMEYVQDRIVSVEYMRRFEIKIAEALPQGPPCLQTLCQSGFPDGTRNQGLFAMGVYAKKVDPDGWQKLVEDYNQKYMQPPLSPREVLTTIQSLGRKDYNYPCKKQPICGHCNLALCRTKKFGVGEGSGLPEMGTLTKLDAQPAVWFVDVDGQRMQLTTEELQSPVLFQRRCLEVLNTMPILPTKAEWAMVVQQLLANVSVVPVPKEATPTGQLTLLLEEFLVTRSNDDNAECMSRGLVWNNDGHHHFRLSDFLVFLDRRKFFEFKRNQIVSILKDLGCKHKGVNLHKGKFINAYVFPIIADGEPQFEPPKQQGTDIPY